MLGVLLKKQLIEKLSVFKKDNKRPDILGAVLSFLLVGGIIAVCVLVLSKFITLYCNVRIDGLTDVKTRQFELLTCLYGAIILIAVISGIRELNFALFESEDRNIFITLPINSKVIFLSKLITVYLKQLVVLALTLIPVNLTFAVVAHQSAYYILMTIVMCFVFPVISLSISAVFCLPVYYVKHKIQSKYLFILIIVTVVFGLLFWGYSRILTFVETILTTGEIKFFFKESTMTAIARVTEALYPANVAARILLKDGIGKNIGILIGFLAGFGGAGFLIVSLLYYKTNLLRSANNRPTVNKKRRMPRAKSQTGALVSKEFGLIFKTPSYAIQYFSVAAIMPLMVYFCMGIGTDLLSSLTFTKNNFELAVIIVLMFGTLTNTFCATNISREGPAFYTLKTLPLKFEKILGAKLMFSSLIAVFSNAVSIIVISSIGYITFGQGAVLFLAAILLSEAQILFATRKDLNRPSLKTEDDCEVRESSRAVSEIIVTGLLIDIVIGGLALYLAITRIGAASEYQWITVVLTVVSALILFAVSAVYMFVGLKKRVYEMTEDN